MRNNSKFNPKACGQNSKLQKGQALVTLLFFTIMAITITTSAVIVVLTNATSATVSQQGSDALNVAQSGADEGILQLIRNPNYSGNESFSVGDGTATLNVSNNTIIATGSASNSIRTLQVQTLYNGNTLKIISWKEI